MTEKEVGELRRQLRPDRSAITKLHGCYVNVNREIIATFEQSAGLLTEEENLQYTTLLKKSLSGRLGRNLIDLEFATEQVAHGEHHKLLMDLRETHLEDPELLQTFYQRIIDALHLEDNYLILIAHNTYDVPFRGKDDQRQGDNSTETFSYLLCSICPVKQAKSGLGYDHTDKRFHTSAGDWLAAPPEMGFLFPAFDHRSTNLYNALYYTKSANIDQGFLEAVFHLSAPMSALEQKETFQEVLSALEEECSLEVVQTVNDQLREMMAAHKEAKIAEPLLVSRRDIETALEDCDVSEEALEVFQHTFDRAFGPEGEVPPANLIEAKTLEVRTPDVVIKAPGDSDLVSTRVIDGVKYILVRAEGEVTVNGVVVHLDHAAEPVGV